MEITRMEDINEILNMYHRSILGGHVGAERMKNTIRRFYKWPSMIKDIENYVRSCSICEKNKIGKHTRSPLQITSTGDRIFDHVFIDFVGRISPPSEDGSEYIFTATCDLTKYVIAIPTKDCTALTTAKAFVENIILKFNIPTKLTTDNGTNFTAELFTEVTKLLKIKKILTTRYHPQSNVVERYHRSLNTYLRSFTQKYPDTWHKMLNFATFSYNNTVHSTTGFTPHELTFGFTIQLPTNITGSKPIIYNYENYKNELRSNLHDSYKLAKERILKRKIENKAQHDKKLNSLEIEPNDLVLQKIEVGKGKYHAQYEGPYRVEEVINEVSVRIRKGNKSMIVHKDKLIKAAADYSNENIPEIIPIYEDPN